MAKYPVVNIATRDSIFSVRGTQEEVINHVLGCKDEYILFAVPHPDGGWTRSVVLNQPREVVMIGSQHEIEMDDETGKIIAKTESNERTARVSLD